MSAAQPGRFWLLTLAAMVGVAAGLALGFWQLSRAAQRNERHALVEIRRHAPALDGAALVALAGGRAQAEWRPVQLQGRWVPEQTVYLDNRQMRGRVGFDVLTPLRIEGTTMAVMVQRGWIPRDFTQRERLPAVQTPPGLVRLEGRIAPPPPKLYQFSDSHRGPIRQNLELAVFKADTGLPLLTNLSVQQTGAPSEGLLREWTEAGSGAEKNYGYAFQWFALSGLISILYVWFQFIAPRRRT
jgi:surfeit locus 1 family protein